jgi:hypothetical protein
MKDMLKRSVMMSLFVAAAAVFLYPVMPVSAQSKDVPAKVVEKNDYSQAANWLCRPGQKDACAVDLASTIVAADGTLTQEDWTADPDAPIDCFYVYPTVSRDQTPNSGMIPGPKEKNVIQQQFARFGSQCRVYAPLYRQVTLSALAAVMAGKSMTADWELAYDDVLDAWNYYLKNDNQGRGVVLIGHSQGSRMLTQLIKNEIDGKSIQAKIISALLLGTNIMVPPDKALGGTFQHMPLCRKDGDTGCIITYVSFRSNIPPPENSIFGRNQGNMITACTNPAALGGGDGALRAYMSVSGGSRSASEETFSWVKPPKQITTPFVSLPGLLSSKCVTNKNGSYLEITVHGDPNDPRTDDIKGDVVVGGKVQANWGLHLIDVNLAMGNLIEIVNRQAKEYLNSKKK